MDEHLQQTQLSIYKCVSNPAEWKSKKQNNQTKNRTIDVIIPSAYSTRKYKLRTVVCMQLHFIKHDSIRMMVLQNITIDIFRIKNTDDKFDLFTK